MSRERDEDERIEQLEEDSRFLCALEGCGIDNWEWYERAKDMIKEWDAE